MEWRVVLKLSHDIRCPIKDANENLYASFFIDTRMPLCNLSAPKLLYR